MAGKFNVNKNTPWDDYGDWGKTKGPFTLDHKFKGKPVSSKNDGLPDFSVEGNWSDGSWQNTGISFDMIGEDRHQGNAKFIKDSLKGANITSDSTKPKGIMLSVDGQQRWMNQDTLVKGTNTLVGMAEQVDAKGNVVQGKNYANPEFGRALAQQAADKQQQQHKQDLYKLTGGLLGKAPPPPKKETGNKGSTGSSGSSSGESTTNYDDLVSGKGRSYGKSYSGSKASRRSKAYWNKAQAFKTDPSVRAANLIQSKLGRDPLRDSWTRFGYGNRMQQADYKKGAKNIIDNYNTKTGLINWAKTIDPEHAQVDKDEMITKTFSTVISSEQKANVYRTKYGSRVTGYYWQHTYAYDDRTVKKYGNEGAIMDATYEKIMKKSQDNKKKYGTYYERDPEVKDYQYYTVSDTDFTSYEDYKQQLISAIGNRSTNQQYVIDTIESDTKTVEKKDRSDNIIPQLENTYTVLDDKASVLKDEVGDYDWQKKISQDQFGTDTIQGDSHIGQVLESYGGKVRGGGYYSQDVGKLVRKSKSYETALESQIKQKQDEIDKIELDKTEELTEYYTDKTDKEYGIANKLYLSKSLELTREERAELEYQRRAQGMGGNQEAMQYRPQTSRGRPSLKQKSKESGQYKNKRTRGGKNNLGGLVI